MKLNKILFVGALLSSVYMIGCGKKFETKVTKNGTPVANGEAVSINNVCSTTLSINPKDVYVQNSNSEYDDTYQISGYFSVGSYPNMFSFNLSGSQKQTQVLVTSDGSNKRTIQVTVQCFGTEIASECNESVILVQTMFDDANCFDSNIQLVLHRVNNENYGYTYVGQNLSFEEIVNQVGAF